MNVDGDRSYYSDKYAQNHYGNLPCFILTNGECYFALGMHNTLAKWLHVNGINISKALRFDQFNRNYEISLLLQALDNPKHFRDRKNIQQYTTEGVIYS